VKDAAIVLLVALVAMVVVATAVFAGGDRTVLVAPPDATAEGFVRQLGMKRYELAVHFLSDDLQRHASPTKLRETFEPLRVDIGKPDQVETKTSWTDGDHARVLATYEGRQGDAALYVDLVREHGLWKIATWPLEVVQRP
jgi:hypothetical protein